MKSGNGKARGGLVHPTVLELEEAAEAWLPGRDKAAVRLARAVVRFAKAVNHALARPVRSRGKRLN